jgi:hypothetical protein
MHFFFSGRAKPLEVVGGGKKSKLYWLHRMLLGFMRQNNPYVENKEE